MEIVTPPEFIRKHGDDGVWVEQLSRFVFSDGATTTSRHEEMNEPPAKEVDRLRLVKERTKAILRREEFEYNRFRLDVAERAAMRARGLAMLPAPENWEDQLSTGMQRIQSLVRQVTAEQARFDDLSGVSAQREKKAVEADRRQDELRDVQLKLRKFASPRGVPV